jgi:hypothetical protein
MAVSKERSMIKFTNLKIILQFTISLTLGIIVHESAYGKVQRWTVTKSNFHNKDVKKMKIQNRLIIAKYFEMLKRLVNT